MDPYTSYYSQGEFYLKSAKEKFNEADELKSEMKQENLYDLERAYKRNTIFALITAGQNYANNAISSFEFASSGLPSIATKIGLHVDKPLFVLENYIGTCTKKHLMSHKNRLNVQLEIGHRQFNGTNKLVFI